MTTLEELVGRCLMFGIPGTEVTEDDLRLFEKTRAGGVILYRRNFESVDQLTRLITNFEERLGRRLLVATDHEGGRIIMIRDGVTIFPDNLAMGMVGEVDHVKRQGEIEARELRRLGIDLNLGPVLDVLTDVYSPNIGIRSYGRDPKLVARLGTARMQAMQNAGLSTSAKHFPGKGHSPLDAHLSLPTIRSSWEEMRRVHLVPFLAAIEAGADSIMTSHPLYPELDPTPNCPATFSRRIVHDCLRGELGYAGVIVSDDLEMGAIREISPLRQAGVHAMQAGHDLLLACHDPANQWAVFEGLLDAYKQKLLRLGELEASVHRIEALRARRTRRFEGGAPRPEPDGAELAQAISRRAVTWLMGSIGALRSSGRRTPAVIFPRFSSLADRITIEAPMLREQEFLIDRFQRFNVRPEVQIVGIEPAESEINRAASLAARSEVTILFLYDGRLLPSNKALLDRLQATASALIVALLRDPYDADLIKKDLPCLTAYGWRICQLEALIEQLLSE